ncbi:MAG: hypothetical protein ACMXYF_00460 [Candidatus Woesearchaeota archaeon]
MNTSKQIQKYFSSIESDVSQAISFAKLAKEKGFDPTKHVDVKVAKNLAERVVGLISVLVPQIDGSGVVERIIELEKEYGLQDWRVAMQIALEIAQNKFVKFEEQLQAIEAGIRVGFAYVTVGVVSSPLEGFTKIELKKRRDSGKEYFAMHFAGPVRNAGGTAAATSVIIADYVRKHLGFEKYDPDEKELERCYTEIMDYHERVTNLQYVPSKEESIYMCQHCPIEIDGDPSEKFEVSNYKDLPRIKANRIRSGFCLIHSSCLPLKAKKLWKNLAKWYEQMGMQDWKFMETFLDIQKKATSTQSSQKTEEKKEQTLEEKNVYPVYTYVADLVGGRPVIGHPLRGFRLRYGRSRVSGFSAQSIHPAAMIILDNFIANATQLKVERPGKAAAFTSCDTIEGPTVLLEDGSVVQVNTISLAKKIHSQVKRILYLGDVLVNFGDFFDRAHTLLSPGYCQEWWVCEFEKIIEEKQLTKEIIVKKIDCSLDVLTNLLEKPITTTISPEIAFSLSKTYTVPLHPQWVYFWKLLTPELFEQLLVSLYDGRLQEKIILKKTAKTALEKLAIPHTVSADFVIIEKDYAFALLQTLAIESNQDAHKRLEEYKKERKNPLLFIQSLHSFLVRDKAGVFIGSRMGRPEKAKMRKTTGSTYGVAPQKIITRDPSNYQNQSVEIITEHPLKKKLRETYDVYANKDGTIRYDASEVPITHFKPNEVGASISRLKKLGYTIDIHGNKIENEDQVIELFPQDIVIPCCLDSPFEPADEVLFRVARYVDDELSQLYSLKPYYNLKTKEDLIGLLVFALAPHTSAASVGRIVGFTKNQGMYCHPMFHAAMRRDCFTYNTYIPVKKKGIWTQEKIGDLVEKLNPTNVVDDFETLECKPKGYKTLGVVQGKITEVPINNFTKHTPQEIIRIKTKLGRVLETTIRHKHITVDGIKEANKLKIGDCLKIPKHDFLDASQSLYCNPSKLKDLPQDEDYYYETISLLTVLENQPSYCLNVQNNIVVANGILTRQCDGDESCFFLLMDGLLNFSTKFLPKHRGGTMDAPLVLTSIINPMEVDDMVFNMDIAWKYPLEFYQACEQYKKPWDVKIPLFQDTLGKPEQFEGMGFTHDTSNFNDGVSCSAYKILPSMREKVDGQMRLAEKIDAVDQSAVAQTVIQKHFLRDTLGNLRKYTQQEFRCVKCNTKYRRPPISGTCKTCASQKIIFTISKGSVVKYLELSQKLGKKYNIDPYIQDVLEALQNRIDGVFGKQKEKQSGLNEFFG